MFTNIGILSAGETVYFGPRVEIIPHFASTGYQCPMYLNPAEYFISLVNADFDGHADIPSLVNAYNGSETQRALDASITADRNSSHAAKVVEYSTPSSFRQFTVLMYRNTINNIRNPGIYWMRLFMY
ncbi:hypothetical protein PybrP1_000196, partial [[Pythium] brassicae (nom. inval.)]